MGRKPLLCADRQWGAGEGQEKGDRRKRAPGSRGQTHQTPQLEEGGESNEAEGDHGPPSEAGLGQLLPLLS